MNKKRTVPDSTHLVAMTIVIRAWRVIAAFKKEGNQAMGLFGIRVNKEKPGYLVRENSCGMIQVDFTLWTE
jgi:hypothetical protein